MSDKLSYEEFVKTFIDNINEQTPHIKEMWEQASKFTIFQPMLEEFTKNLYEDYLNGKLNNKQ